jgi:hypothetical protein
MAKRKAISFSCDKKILEAILSYIGWPAQSCDTSQNNLIAKINRTLLRGNKQVNKIVFTKAEKELAHEFVKICLKFTGQLTIITKKLKIKE